MSLWVPTRNIWVPRRGVQWRGDGGFIAPGLVGVVTASRRRSVSSYIVEQDFESGVRPTGWSDIAGTPDYNYTAAPLRGSVSLECASGDIADSVAFSALSSCWVHLMWKYSATPSEATYMVYLMNGTTRVAGLRALASAGTIRLYCGGTNWDVVGWAAGTTYHLWIEYVAGSGVNGIARLYRGTTTTRPSVTAQITNGNATLGCDRLRFYGGNSAAGYVDQVLVSTTEIGDVPT